MPRSTKSLASLAILLSLTLVTLAWSHAFAAEDAAPAQPAGTGILVLQPGPEGMDASVSSYEPGTNVGDAQWLYGMGLPNNHLGFIRFDLSGLPGDAVVTSAQIELWGRYMDGQFILSPVAAPWTESTITWSNQPAAVMPSMAVSYPISRGLPSGTCYWGCTMSFDVTAIVQAWVAGTLTNHGFKVAGDTPGYGWLMSASDNLTNPRPLLRVTYESSTPVGMGSWGALKTRYR